MSQLARPFTTWVAGGRTDMAGVLLTGQHISRPREILAALRYGAES